MGVVNRRIGSAMYVTFYPGKYLPRGQLTTDYDDAMA